MKKKYQEPVPDIGYVVTIGECGFTGAGYEVDGRK